MLVKSCELFVSSLQARLKLRALPARADEVGCPALYPFPAVPALLYLPNDTTPSRWRKLDRSSGIFALLLSRACKSSLSVCISLHRQRQSVLQAATRYKPREKQRSTARGPYLRPQSRLSWTDTSWLPTKTLSSCSLVCHTVACSTFRVRKAAIIHDPLN